MKKLLILCLTGLLVSCSHDFPNGQEIKEIVQSSYDRSFIKAFGQVGENVDWGFSSNNTRAISDYTSYKGNMQPNVTFPTDCDINEFTPDLTNVKSYEEFLQSKGTQWWTPTEINESAEVYIDHVRNVKMTGGNTKSKLYLKAGTYDFTNEEFNVCANADVYLLSGTTLILNNTAASTAKFNVYIAQGSELKVNTKYRADVDAHIYNHGTITCVGFEVNGKSTLYNVGTVTSTGEIFIENSTAKIVNDGAITCPSAFVKGSGALQNNAEWTVTGNTIVNCNNGGWVNNGHWTTQNYYYTAGSENVINNCFLEVKNDFNINMSSANPNNGFKIDSNCGVLTKNFYGGKAGDDPNSKSGPYKVIMGHKSLFKVTGTATLEGGNPGWGFFGPNSGEYAVFQAKDIVRATGLENTQGAVTYSGNLYISSETHFGKGTLYDTYIYEEGNFDVNTNIYASGFKGGKPTITIEETPCNPGFKGGEKTVYRVIAEDLSAEQEGDFDFNDVVFDVLKSENGVTLLKLICAGGTLPLKVMGIEVHGLFGETTPDADGKYKMYNTGAGPNVSPVTFEVQGVYTTPEQIKNIVIEVYKEGGWIELTATRGKPACKILVDNSFIPVTERQNIADQYGNFTNYVQGAFVNDFWWN